MIMRTINLFLSLSTILLFFNCERTDIKNPEDYYTVRYEIAGDEMANMEQIQYRNESGGIETITKIENPFVREVYVKKGFQAYFSCTGYASETPDLSINFSYVNDLKTDELYLFTRLSDSGPIDFTIEREIK